MLGGVQLAYRSYSTGGPTKGGSPAGHPAPELLFLHGLFGSSQNWAGFARRLAPVARSWGLDLRNHGDSPHADTHGLVECAEDVREWVEERQAAGELAGPPVLVGHSMGGLVAMAATLRHPHLPRGIVVIDVAPRAYPLDHEAEFRALRTDISGCGSRAALDALLAPVLPDARMRSFILTNAVPAGNGYRWRLGIEAIAASTLLEEAGRLEGRFAGPALFVAAGRSDRVRAEDGERIRQLFPEARIVPLPSADHWVNASAPDELERATRELLTEVAGTGRGAS